jgi:hypothetical protein
LVNSTNYGSPYYTIISIFLVLHPLSSALWSRTPSIWVLPLECKTKFTSMRLTVRKYFTVVCITGHCVGEIIFTRGADEAISKWSRAPEPHENICALKKTGNYLWVIFTEWVYFNKGTREQINTKPLIINSEKIF